jgi:hypothetical protein
MAAARSETNAMTVRMEPPWVAVAESRQCIRPIPALEGGGSGHLATGW